MQKGFSSVIILIIILLSAGIVGTYYFGKLSNKSTPSLPPQTETPQPTIAPSPTSDELARWKEYASRKYSFSIKYPQDWIYKEVSVLAPSIDEVWFSTKSLGFPPEGTDARTPVVLKVSKDDLSKDWQAEFFNDYKSSTYSLALGVSAKKITGINKESLYPEVAVIINTGNFYVVALPNQGSESTKYFDQILSTFKFLDQNQSEDRAKCTKDEDCTVDGCSCEPINKAYRDNSKKSCALACPGREIKCANNRCVVVQ